jgi:hypothetical protein
VLADFRAHTVTAVPLIVLLAFSLQVVWMTDTSAAAVAARAAEQLTAATAAMVTQGNIEAERAEAKKKAKAEAKKKVRQPERYIFCYVCSVLGGGDSVFGVEQMCSVV